MQQSWRVLSEAQSQHKLVLFEGAQGIMLDIGQHYPFVTSSTRWQDKLQPGRYSPCSVGFVLGITQPIPRGWVPARSRLRILPKMGIWVSGVASLALLLGANAVAVGLMR